MKIREEILKEVFLMCVQEYIAEEQPKSEKHIEALIRRVWDGLTRADMFIGYRGTKQGLDIRNDIIRIYTSNWKGNGNVRN